MDYGLTPFVTGGRLYSSTNFATAHMVTHPGLPLHSHRLAVHHLGCCCNDWAHCLPGLLLLCCWMCPTVLSHVTGAYCNAMPSLTAQQRCRPTSARLPLHEPWEAPPRPRACSSTTQQQRSLSGRPAAFLQAPELITEGLLTPAADVYR